MKKYIFIFLLSIFTIFTAACGAGETQSNDNKATADNNTANEIVTVTHELGETEVQKNPEKIIVFDFGALDTLDKMGVDITGLPKSGAVPPYLSKYEEDKYANVGSLKEPDFEKIAEIGPDLIIISGRQAELYEEFSKIGPTIFVGLDLNNYMDSFKNNVRTLGEIFGKEDFVEEELTKIDEQIEQVRSEVTNLGKNALIVLVNEGKVNAFGPGSRFGLIHDVLGFTPVDESIKVATHGETISFEFIVEKDPDYLFVVDRTAVVGGNGSAKEVIENELTENTKAYQDGNIVYFRSELLVSFLAAD